MSELLSESEITGPKIESLFKAAFIKTESDDNADFMIRDETGINTLVKVDAEKKLLYFFCFFRLKAEVSDADKLAFVNELNQGLILVRFLVPNPNMLWCDCHIMYEGGVPPYMVVNTYKRFVSVCRTAIQRDTNDIIG